ncbi:transcriptional regulator [Bacillus phage JBP901]|uniref:Putative transcriptional regulator n=1 Tax=Bacillus phage JBP901 TaxID=1498212 RepID=A0A0E3DEY4_9CAUD|nr:transcriptional regulator [Bacillus phage JBP901]AID17869.1 putative transcriptional regulator [Bacillus phage JBP901]
MKLVIFENATHEEEKALVDLDTGEEILNGDYYHDKIDYRIEGYLAALKDHGIYTDEVPTEEVGKKHEYFAKLRFYDGDYEEEEEDEE